MAILQPPVIDVEHVRLRIKALIDFQQFGKNSATFTPPFTLEKIEHLVQAILVLVQYNGSLNKESLAAKIKAQHGPNYVEMKTVPALITAMINTREFLPVLNDL